MIRSICEFLTTWLCLGSIVKDAQARQRAAESPQWGLWTGSSCQLAPYGSTSSADGQKTPRQTLLLPSPSWATMLKLEDVGAAGLSQQRRFCGSPRPPTGTTPAAPRIGTRPGPPAVFGPVPWELSACLARDKHLSATYRCRRPCSHVPMFQCVPACQCLHACTPAHTQRPAGGFNRGSLIFPD